MNHRSFITGPFAPDITNADFFELLDILNIFSPLQSFFILGEKDSVLTFQDPVDWDTDGIQTLLKVHLGERIILILTFINPLTVEPGIHEVAVAGCTGTVDFQSP